jgi:hypothetical protein
VGFPGLPTDFRALDANIDRDIDKVMRSPGNASLNNDPNQLAVGLKIASSAEAAAQSERSDIVTDFIRDILAYWMDLYKEFASAENYSAIEGESFPIGWSREEIQGKFDLEVKPFSMSYEDPVILRRQYIDLLNLLAAQPIQMWLKEQGYAVDVAKIVRRILETYDERDVDSFVFNQQALPEMQVMDATNGDPGYGVTPARDDSPEERARVGRDYLAAMTEKYQGDTDKIMAAYNAGPGAVDAQVKERGAAWLDGMPKETRDYVAKGRRKMGAETPAQPADPMTLAAERGATSPEVLDAARVRVLDDTMARSLPDVPGAHAELMKAADMVAAGDIPVLREAVVRRVPSVDEFMAQANVRDAVPPPEVRGNFLAWINRQGGLSAAEKVDITGEANGVRANPGGIFRRGGVSSDDLALRAAQDGYLLPDQAGDTPAFVELVKRAVSGERVLNMEEQGGAAARGAFLSEMDQRFADVSRRLEALGVDAKPYRGNVAALEAYANQYEPQLMRVAMDEVTGQSPGASFADFAAMMDKARSIANDVQDGGRTLDEFEADFGPLSPAMRRMVSDELEPVKATPAAQAEAAAVTTRLDAIRADFPDLMVQMDGMDAPMRLDDFLAAAKADADEMLADAPLLQRAAECAIINGL